jgi:hypothetical protein
MVLPEPRSFGGGPPAAGARPSQGAAARRLLGLLRGALLGRWRSDLGAGTRRTLSPRRGPWLGRRSDHGGGRSGLVLGPLGGRGAAPGVERAKKAGGCSRGGPLLVQGCWRELARGGRPAFPPALEPEPVRAPSTEHRAPSTEHRAPSPARPARRLAHLVFWQAQQIQSSSFFW